ncbi:putative integrase-like protein [Frog virus 3]|uniref:Putative integrase-like protein n=2 Tax=Ranavirus TaxID=10492 RepID=A0A220IH24_FRG3V|nr:putative integrase-like protein [Common midwife toad virus]ASH99289.1 putative integrase-like protein [Frog virus 3]
MLLHLILILKVSCPNVI